MLEARDRAGIYLMLDLHAHPGAQNQHWHSNKPDALRVLLAASAFPGSHDQHLGKACRPGTSSNPAIAGYNIMNEPGDASGLKIKPFYDRAVAAVR